MSTERLLVLTSIIIWLLLTFLSSYWIQAASGYVIGNRRRIIAVLRIECILSLLNIFAHGQLMKWFDDDLTKEKPVDRRKLQAIKRQCSVALIVFLLLGQAVYFMYYAPEFLQWLLFDLTSICAGIWTNMIAFVCGFGLVNFFAGKMKLFHITSMFLEFIQKLPFMFNLIWCRKTQIKFTIVITLIMSIGMYVSRDWIVVKHKTIEIKNFSATDGRLRLAVISDLHAGASVYKEQIHQVVEKVLMNKVDAVLIVGDMVDAPVAEIEDRVSPIFQLPVHAPTYFVTGNHEYYYGNVREWLNLYKKVHINVLENESKLLKGVCIVGVNDISSTKTGIANHVMDLQKAAENCPENTSQIVMAHNPASINEFIVDHPHELSKIDLIVSGHTHAGQFYVVIPIVYWLLPYFYGLYDVTMSTQLMVTAGSLYQGPPMKMIGMSEVWVLDLVGV